MGWLYVLWVNCKRGLQNALRRLFFRKRAYVMLPLEGPLPEFTDPLGFIQKRLRGGQQPVSLQRLREVLRRLAADPRVVGVIIRHDGFGGGFATLQAFHQELVRFKESGKRVVSLLMASDTQTYLAAFYETLGFRATSAPFDDYGVPHVDMALAKPRMR